MPCMYFIPTAQQRQLLIEWGVDVETAVGMRNAIYCSVRRTQHAKADVEVVSGDDRLVLKHVDTFEIITARAMLSIQWFIAYRITHSMAFLDYIDDRTLVAFFEHTRPMRHLLRMLRSATDAIAVLNALPSAHAKSTRLKRLVDALREQPPPQIEIDPPIQFWARWCVERGFPTAYSIMLTQDDAVPSFVDVAQVARLVEARDVSLRSLRAAAILEKSDANLDLVLPNADAVSHPPHVAVNLHDVEFVSKMQRYQLMQHVATEPPLLHDKTCSPPTYVGEMFPVPSTGAIKAVVVQSVCAGPMLDNFVRCEKPTACCVRIESCPSTDLPRLCARTDSFLWRDVCDAIADDDVCRARRAIGSRFVHKCKITYAAIDDIRRVHARWSHRRTAVKARSPAQPTCARLASAMSDEERTLSHFLTRVGDLLDALTVRPLSKH